MATNLHKKTSLPFFSEQTTQYQESCCLHQGEDGSIILFKAPVDLNLWYFWKGLVYIPKHETLLPSSGTKNPVLKQMASVDQTVKPTAEWAQTPLQPQLISADACDQSPKRLSYVWSTVLAFGFISAGKANPLETVRDRATETKKSWWSLSLAMQLVSECWGFASRNRTLGGN